MKALQDQMLMDMELRNLSPMTIKAYSRHITKYSEMFKKSPENLGLAEIRQYLYHLKKGGASWSAINIGYSALKYCYTQTLHQPWNVEHIPRPKGEKKLPVVLSREEIIQIFKATTNIKHRALLMAIYSGGLRVSEAAHLKIKDIDSHRMLIRVNQGKGKKDRYTLLSQVALKQLRHYYQIYRPSSWLFPGNPKERPLCSASIQLVLRQLREKTGILKQITPHTLRHSFATHFLEDEGDVFRLKELMGHSSLKTTMLYIHIQHKNLKRITSPLDLIMGEVVQ